MANKTAVPDRRGGPGRSRNTRSAKTQTFLTKAGADPVEHGARLLVDSMGSYSKARETIEQGLVLLASADISDEDRDQIHGDVRLAHMAVVEERDFSADIIKLLLPYFTPKLRSVEFKPEEGDVTIVVNTGMKNGPGELVEKPRLTSETKGDEFAN